MTTINMIWLGDHSESVQGCIDSFARFHQVHLWSYPAPPIDIILPPGVVLPEIKIYASCILRDANEIINQADLHANLTRIPSITDWLRINLIYQLGGWYSDCDNYCIGELDFKRREVFTFFSGESGDLNNSIFKCSKGSPILKELIDSYTFHPDRAAYLEFSEKCSGKPALYLNSDILHFKMQDLDRLEPASTKVIHLFSARRESKNLEFINQIKEKLNGSS